MANTVVRPTGIRLGDTTQINFKLGNYDANGVWVAFTPSEMTSLSATTSLIIRKTVAWSTTQKGIEVDILLPYTSKDSASATLVFELATDTIPTIGYYLFLVKCVFSDGSQFTILDNISITVF